MTVVQRFDGDATVVYSAGTWTSLADPYARNGNYHFSSTAGATVTITLPANHGFNALMLYCTSRGDSATGVTVSIDGVAQPVWNQSSGSGFSSQYYNRYQDCYPRPLTLNPAKGTTQVIVITNPAATFFTFNFYEAITAVAPIVGQLEVFGHSWAWAVTNGSDGTQVPGRFGVKIANYTGLTEFNHGAPAADVSNGSQGSGVAAPAVARYANFVSWDNQAIPTPDWMRALDGANWTKPAMGPLVLTPPGGQPATGPQWAGFRPVRALLMHGVNDAGFATIHENPILTGSTFDGGPAGGNMNRIAAWKQIQTLTGTAAFTSGDFTITGPDVNGVARTTLAISALADLPTVQSRLLNATGGAIDYAASGTPASGQFFNSTSSVMTFTALHSKAPAVALTRTIGTALSSGTLTFATTQVGQNNITPANAGFALKRFIDRMRMMLLKMIQEVPACKIDVFDIGNAFLGAQTNVALYKVWNDAIAALCAESWIPAGTVMLVPLLDAMTGPNVGYGTDGHPSGDVGHQIIFEQWVKAYEAANNRIKPTGSARR